MKVLAIRPRLARKIESVLMMVPWVLALASLSVSVGGTLLAQISAETCVISFGGQNRYRKVSGYLDAECAPVTFPTQWHDPPWGNWGVSSHYGNKENTDQFKGWKRKDRKFQWNSCTAYAEYTPPNSAYYNSSDHRSQKSDGIVTHGVMEFRETAFCPDPADYDADPPVVCASVEGWDIRQSENYMTIYELDSPERDVLIESLYFPGTVVTLGSCDRDSCPERKSGWVAMTRSTSSTVHVEAELRMKASAQLVDACDWHW
ncbi:MAG: hypothetical protein F4041_07530 [Acidobacteriia bacterium]|nr:hypothetical protein [Terriglobia bacterium]MYK09476.1 hypothetical protein [Terriglobia bacterium]